MAKLKVGVICPDQRTFDAYLADILYAECKWREYEPNQGTNVCSEYHQISKIDDVEGLFFSKIIRIGDVGRVRHLDELTNVANQRIVSWVRHI